MGEGTEGTSIKMPTFDGSASNHQRFKLRFRAYANATIESSKHKLSDA